MITVTNLAGTITEPIFDISSDFVMNQSVTGELEIAFTCYPSDKNPGYDILGSESLLEIDGLEFKVKNYTSDGYYKKVNAPSLFYENSKKLVRGIYSGDNTLTSHLEFIFNDNDWRYTLDNDIANSVNEIFDLGNNNVVFLLKQIIERHNVEFQILPNKRIQFSRRLGPDTDFQYRYKHNLESVVRTEDTSNVYTRITGFSFNGNSTVYTSPLASVFGILEAPDYVNPSITNETALYNYLSTIIKDVPDLSIDSKIQALTEREIGSSVWLIYEPLGIEMKTRILKQTKKIINGELVTTEINIGNTLNKNIIDLIVDQQSSQNQTIKDLQASASRPDEIELRLQALELRVQEGFALLATSDSGLQNEIALLRNDLNVNINSLVVQLSEKVDRNRIIQEINSTLGSERINTSKLDLSGDT